jgi:hypothetical protein
MRDRQHATLRDLREAIECLPRRTRLAMLEGIERNAIIVGAYSHQDGICPMLAAHRAGGRTNFIGFARAWDAFAFRGSRRCGARRATERELLVLRTHLQASLLADDCPTADLAAAVSEHRELMARRAAGPARSSNEAAATGPAAAPAPGAGAARPGDPDRSRELRRRPGWRWMRVVRSVEEFQSVLAALEHDATESEVPRSSVLAGRE